MLALYYVYGLKGQLLVLVGYMILFDCNNCPIESKDSNTPRRCLDSTKKPLTNFSRYHARVINHARFFY